MDRSAVAAGPNAVSGRLVSFASAVLTQRQPFVNSIFELVLTSSLLFGVTTIVRVIIGPSQVSRSLPNIHVQLGLVGASVALLVPGLILSPLGKASGGHMNPAISLAMSCWGVFPRDCVVPYTAAQLSGSFLGVLLARLAWGPVVAARPVAYAVLQPSAGWTQSELFVAEAAGVAVIVLVVGVCLSDHQLTRYAPWIVGALTGLAIALLGNSTGASLNPARQFGPALASGQLHFFWVYLTAPMTGAAFAVWLRARFQSKLLLTHRLGGSI